MGGVLFSTSLFDESLRAGSGVPIIFLNKTRGLFISLKRVEVGRGDRGEERGDVRGDRGDWGVDREEREGDVRLD